MYIYIYYIIELKSILNAYLNFAKGILFYEENFGSEEGQGWFFFFQFFVIENLANFPIKKIN